MHQSGSNLSQRSNSPLPSAPYPTNVSSPDMDVPPNYDEAMTLVSKDQKK